MRDADDGMQMINCGPQGGHEAGHIQRVAALVYIFT